MVRLTLLPNASMRTLRSSAKALQIKRVIKSILYGRYTSQLASHAAAALYHFSIEQEKQLILEINDYASGGTRGVPRDAKDLTEDTVNHP